MTTPEKTAEEPSLEDTRDDPQTQPMSATPMRADELQAENAGTSLDQPSS